jgi:hypothetical protein
MPDATSHRAAELEHPDFPGKCRGGFLSAPAMAQGDRTYPCPVCGRKVRVMSQGWYYHHKPKVAA